MNKSKLFTLEDTNPISWGEFDSIVQKLISDITLYCSNTSIHIDAVCPILRNGAIPATMIANKLRIVPMLPVQVKCDYTKGKPVQLLPFARSLSPIVSANPTLLVVECNTFSGESARLAGSIIKESYSDAILMYATVTRVFRKVPIDLSIYTHTFTGMLTNENFEASVEEESRQHMRKKVVIYPWETAEFEISDINATMKNE